MTSNGVEDPIVRLYRKRAQSYDASGIGGLNFKRAQAIDLLGLTSGDVVDELEKGNVYMRMKWNPGDR
jgi:hypothetical protein